MPSSYLRIVLHTTFSTKYRVPSISPNVESRLYQVMDSRLRALGCERYAIGGTMDHIHLVHGLPRDRTIASIACDIKSISSKWMRAHGYPDFEWQVGYASHSVNYRSIERVIRYVNDQKKHHYGSEGNYANKALLTFEEEFERLLLRFGMEYRTRWLFPRAPCNRQDQSAATLPLPPCRTAP